MDVDEATQVERAVRDLPQLERLHACVGNIWFGDVSLAAIVEHSSGR